MINEKDKGIDIDSKKNELKENNSFNDITGNMNVWRVHETYEGSGNEYTREEIKSKKNNFKN